MTIFANFYKPFLYAWIVCNILATIETRAQDIMEKDSIAIGKQVPDFELSDLARPGNTTRLSAFRGRAVLLDFWATWCSPCVGSLPKLHTLKQKYRDQLQIILISTENVAIVREFMDKLLKNTGYTFFNVVKVSTFSKLFDVRYLPHYILIDKDGVLRARTGEITESQIDSLIERKTFAITDQSAIESQVINSGGLINKLVDDKIKLESAPLLYQALLSGYLEGETPRYALTYSGTTAENRKVKVINASLPNLYRMAIGGELLGKAYPLIQTSVEVMDTTRYRLIEPKKENLYTYQLTIPSPNRTQLFGMMRVDLDRYFDLSAKIEKRNTRCLVLKVLNRKDLKISSDTSFIDHSLFWLSMKNRPLSDFLSVFRSYNSGIYPNKPVIIDETGYMERIDIELKGRLNDIISVNKQLLKQGLYLSAEKRPVDILVIREKTGGLKRSYR